MHAASRVTWQLLARVDAVLDVCGPTTTPRATLAALGAGRAVVAVSRHPAAELVENGTSGVLVPLVDRTRFPAALSELLGSTTSLSTMGAAAQAALGDAITRRRSAPSGWPRSTTAWCADPARLQSAGAWGWLGPSGRTARHAFLPLQRTVVVLSTQQALPAEASPAGLATRSRAVSEPSCLLVRRADPYRWVVAGRR